MLGGRALDTAFQDLSALMSQAQDMVALAERFHVAAARSAAQQVGSKPSLNPNHCVIYPK